MVEMKKIKKGWGEYKETIKEKDKTILLGICAVKNIMYSPQKKHEKVLDCLADATLTLSNIPKISPAELDTLMDSAKIILDNCKLDDIVFADYETIEWLLNQYLSIGHADMKDIFDVVDKVFSKTLEYTKEYKDFSKELKKLGIRGVSL